jgi:ferredoxin
MKMISLFCRITNKEYKIPYGMELLKAFQMDCSLPFKWGCCQGECGTCLIKVTEGHENLSKMTKQEVKTLSLKGKDPSQHRLACQCAIYGPVILEFTTQINKDE